MTNSFSKLGGFQDRIYKDGMCFLNAAHNQEHAFKDLDLHIVCGSLGLSGHYEYGGKKWGIAEFSRKPNDSHVWLEDSEGNVYDYVHASWSYYARCWGKEPRWEDNTELFGESKKDLAQIGLSYIPAPADAQDVIRRHFVIVGMMLKGVGAF